MVEDFVKGKSVLPLATDINHNCISLDSEKAQVGKKKTSADQRGEVSKVCLSLSLRARLHRKCTTTYMFGRGVKLCFSLGYIITMVTAYSLPSQPATLDFLLVH